MGYVPKLGKGMGGKVPAEASRARQGDWKTKPSQAWARLLYFFLASRDVSRQTGMFPGVTVAET